MISPAERRDLGRLLSAVQNDDDGEGGCAAPYYRHGGKAISVAALTGPPGAGKSSLLDRIATNWAEQGQRVAVLAVDPSSPFSGGAVLGDRIRANTATSHPNVYMRSLSARSSLDSLITTVVDSCAVFTHSGFDRVLLETVGAGQMNLEALDLADCIVGVSVPGLGDAVQLSKAGLLEIADIHVVNKCDLDGARKLHTGLESMLDVTYPAPGHGFSETRRGQPGVRALLSRHGDPEKEQAWRPPVLSVSATENTGIDAICDCVGRFLDWQAATGRHQHRRHARLTNVLSIRLRQKLLRDWKGKGGDALARLAVEIAAGRLDPQAAVRQLTADNDAARQIRKGEAR